MKDELRDREAIIGGVGSIDIAIKWWLDMFLWGELDFFV
jgi:hypothetical protein